MPANRTYVTLRNTTLVLLLAAATVGVGPGACARPMYPYLTYSGDPSTSIVVNYQTRGATETTMVYYDTIARGGRPTAYALSAAGEGVQIPGLPVKRTIHHVTLTDLTPNTVYYFVAGDQRAGFTEERMFKTIPSGDEPIRFVVGGDMGASPLTEALQVRAAAQDPAFAVVGGDIAYANGDLRRWRDWDKWFANWDRHMRAPDGRMIPLFVAIGNHEVNDSPSSDPAARAPFYFGFFGQQAGRTYFDRRFGPNIAFVALDSGHLVPHDGEQAAWLRETLDKYAEVPFKFAVYHVPLYPSHRSYDGESSVQGRTYWAPVFDEFQLTAAFENHDHTLKRTKLIFDGQVADQGVLYLGDGSWGVVPRSVDAELRWYEAFAAGKGHVWIVDVATDGVTYRAIGVLGTVLDQCTSPRVEAAVPP